MSADIRIVFLCVAVFAVQPGSDAADAPRATQAVQKLLEAAQKAQLEAEKDVALRKAALDVAQKRVAELEKQLSDSKKQADADSKALQAAMTAQATAATRLAEVHEQLKVHQAADQLLARAEAARQAAAAAHQKHQAAEQALRETVLGMTDQQKAEAAASASLKAAQEKLPVTTAELQKLRSDYDRAGREADRAQAVVNEVRSAVRAADAALQVERARAQRAASVKTQVTAAVESLKKSREALAAAATSAGLNAAEAGAEVAAGIEAMAPLVKQADDLVQSAAAGQAKAQEALNAESRKLEETQNVLRQNQTAYAELSRNHFRLQLAIADLQGAERVQQKQIASAKEQQKILSARLLELEPQLPVLLAEAESLDATAVRERQTAEQALIPLGRFVSFSEHVAPIFARRCVACHNTRTASGQLNMDSFEALMQGGESGAVVSGHHADDSSLWAMIADGSMPKDADPLTDEEKAVVKNWIDVGAPLDAGVSATAALFQVMPEVAQPLPPESYRVPIPVTATAFTADSEILASSGYHEVLLWKTSDGSLLRRISNVAERVYDLEFSGDGKVLAVAAGTPGQLGEVKLFDVADGSHKATLQRTQDAIFAVSFSPDGRLLAAAGADHRVSVMDVSSGEIRFTLEDHSDWVMDVSWSADGTRLVTASRDKTARVVDVAKGESIATFNGHGDTVYSAAFLADGQSVVSGGSDRQCRVWKVSDASEVRKIGGFGSEIFKVAVTADNHVFTACADRNAREHNLADGKSIRTFSGHKDWVYTLSYNASKKLIATGSYDGEIRVWNSEDGSVATSFIAIPGGKESSTVATTK
ncbi:MAG: c-type cytochrome domain-containing protein [Planctomycetaceae bacterium]